VLVCRELFDALGRCETMLGSSRYLVGNQLTEADVRLFMTLIRFDHVSGSLGEGWGQEGRGGGEGWRAAAAVC